MKIVRSKRKSISIEVNADAEVIIRAPKWMSSREIAEFAEKHQAFVDRSIARMKRRQEILGSVTRLTEDERKELTEKARQVIPERVAYYAPIVGVTYGRITIRNQRTRWGSCSAKGNLNFNLALMKAPPQVLDYVVVHELCHRLEMNHSVRFWEKVESVFPEYKACRKWLKNNGAGIMAQIGGAK